MVLEVPVAAKSSEDVLVLGEGNPQKGLLGRVGRGRKDLRPPGKQWTLIWCCGTELLELHFLAWEFLSYWQLQVIETVVNEEGWRSQLQLGEMAAHCELSQTLRCYHGAQQVSVKRWWGQWTESQLQLQAEKRASYLKNWLVWWPLANLSFFCIPADKKQTLLQISLYRLWENWFSWCKTSGNWWPDTQMPHLCVPWWKSSTKVSGCSLMETEQAAPPQPDVRVA